MVCAPSTLLQLHLVPRRAALPCGPWLPGGPTNSGSPCCLAWGSRPPGQGLPQSGRRGKESRGRTPGGRRLGASPRSGAPLPERRRRPGAPPGGGTPASLLTAAMAQHTDLVHAYPVSGPLRSARNSANRRGSAGSQGTPRSRANSAQRRSGPRYRFHVCGAKPRAIASATALGTAALLPARSATASAMSSWAPAERRFMLRWQPARRLAIASRSSSRLRSSAREGWLPAIEAQREDQRVT